MVKKQVHPFIKLSGLSEADFYKTYPDDKSFFKAFPQARYGMALIGDSVPGPDGDGTGLGTAGYFGDNPNAAKGKQDPTRGFTAANHPNIRFGQSTGKPVVQKKATVRKKPLGPDYDPDSDDTDPTVVNPSVTDEDPNAPHSLHVFNRDWQMHWNPKFNSGGDRGIRTNDLVAGTTSFLAGALPFTKPKSNAKVLQPSVNPFPQGIQDSRASFKYGGSIDYIEGKYYDLNKTEIKRLEKLGYKLEY